MDPLKNSNLLEYQPPVERAISVEEELAVVHVDAGILSNADFTIFMLRASTETILRGVFCVVVEALIFNSIGAHWGVLLFAVFLTVAYFVHSMFGQARGRRSRQMCGVENGVIYFSSPATGSSAVLLDMSTTWKIIARRHRVRTNKWRIVARPPSFSFHLSSENCPRATNLLVGLNRATAERLAATLEAKMGQKNAQYAKGFEVIVRSQPVE